MMITDLHKILLTSSNALSQYQRKQLPQDFLLSLKQNRYYKEEMMLFLGDQHKVTTFPIMKDNQCVGAFIMLTQQTPYYMIEESLLEFVIEIIEQEISICD
jgi:hypothetical protein